MKHYFRKSFFPSTVTEWNNLDQNICNSECFTTFKGNILKFIHPSKYSIFLCKNSKEIQLLTRLTLFSSHLRQNEFRHIFKDTLNPMCNYGEDTETSCPYLLHCPLFSIEMLVLLNIIRDINNSVSELSDLQIFKVLLHGKNSFDILRYISLLNSPIDFPLITKRFDERLFRSKNQESYGFQHFSFSNFFFPFRHELIYCFYFILLHFIFFHFLPDALDR